MLSCDCDTVWEFFNEEERTARIEHTCGECYKTINPGEVYKYISGKFEGEFTTHKACEECADLAESMQSMGFCWWYGELHADHDEYIQEYQPPPLTEK